MGDGAEWIWNLAAEHFPEAIQIVDLYHARQHLWELARRLHPNDEAKQKAWMQVVRSICWMKEKSKDW
jgi:transposase